MIFPELIRALPVAAQDSLLDPAGSDAIVSAVRWLEGALLGTIATAVAVIAVATVGLLMLTGRINSRYGATVILGCFVLYGARGIANGILNMTGGTTAPAELADRETALSPPASAPKAPAQPSPAYDPYAGASVPPR